MKTRFTRARCGGDFHGQTRRRDEPDSTDRVRAEDAELFFSHEHWWLALYAPALRPWRLEEACRVFGEQVL